MKKIHRLYNKSTKSRAKPRLGIGLESDPEKDRSIFNLVKSYNSSTGILEYLREPIVGRLILILNLITIVLLISFTFKFVNYLSAGNEFIRLSKYEDRRGN